jgi:hypothetical protein
MEAGPISEPTLNPWVECEAYRNLKSLELNFFVITDILGFGKLPNPPFSKGKEER